MRVASQIVLIVAAACVFPLGLSAQSSSVVSGRSDDSTELQPVSKGALELELTAKDLLDKGVYDRDQKKIGKVVDIVLDGQSSPLAFFLSEDSVRPNSDGHIPSNTDGETSRPSTNPTPSLDRDPAASRGGTNRSLSGGYLGRAGEKFSQTSVIVAHGGILKMGQDLLRVPISRLRYDAAEKHLSVDVSSSEITGLSTGVAGNSRR